MPTPSWAEAWSMARASDDPAVLLATIMHEALETVRLVRDTQNLASRGQTFLASWFEVEWVQDDGQVPRCTLSIPNVFPKEVGQRYLRQSTGLEVTLEIVALSAPDEPIARISRLDLKSLQISAAFVTGTLMGKDHSAEPLGNIIVLPSNFQALYRRGRKE